jgi:hypothetical protein
MRAADALIHMRIDRQKRVFESRCLPTGIRCRIRGGISARPAGSTDQTLHQFSLLKKRRKWPQMAHMYGPAVRRKRVSSICWLFGLAAAELSLLRNHPCRFAAGEDHPGRAPSTGCRLGDAEGAVPGHVPVLLRSGRTCRLDAVVA